MRKFALVSVLVGALLAGCGSKLDNFEDTLSRKPDSRIEVPETSPIMSPIETAGAAFQVIKESMEAWERFVLGREQTEIASFVDRIQVFYVLEKDELTAECNGVTVEVHSNRKRPFMCGGILYVPIMGTQIYWQNVRPLNDRPEVSLFIEISGAMGEHYASLLRKFAKDKFQIQLDPPKNTTLFGQCIAGVLAYWSFQDRQSASSKEWSIKLPNHEQEEAAAVKWGFSRTPRDCYDSFWK